MLCELLEDGSILDIIATFVALGLVLAAVLCLVYIIFGGITFILSAGNEDKVKKSADTIRYAVFGLFIAFIAFFVVSFIARILDIPFELNFTTILDLMSDIFNALG